MQTEAQNGYHEPTFVEHRISRGEGSLYARNYAGAEPAFVLMHGFPDNLHIYDGLVPQLVAGGRRVVTFDFLGFGASDKPAGAAYSFAQQVADLKAVVDQLGLAQIVPVGHDSSGPAVLNFAIEHPDRVASAVILNALYCTAPSLRYPEFIELFATKNLQKMTRAILKDPALFAWVLNFQRSEFQGILAEEHRSRYENFLGPLIDQNFRSSPSSAQAFAQMTGELFEEVARNAERLPMVGSLDLPVKLIWGQRDPYLNVGVAQHLLGHLRNANLVSIEAGHWVQIDEPGLVAKEMLGAWSEG